MKKWSVLAVLALALLGCGKTKDPSVPTLVKSLKDPDPGMRYWAVREMGHSARRRRRRCRL
jgi:hypothetical protein